MANQGNFRVSRATLYNTIILLLDARLVIKHHFGNSSQDEKSYNRTTHHHQICTQCGKVTEFLNQETAFLDGGEVLARKFGYAVTYVHITSPKRGYYRARFELITDEPATTAPGEITLRYAELLEANIRQQPELWLWSHNRWKHRREASK